MGALAEALVVTLLPARCARCERALPADGRGGVCPACWAALRPHPGPGCPRCGDPDATAGVACLACRNDPPPWDGAASWGPYGGALRDLLLLLKTAGYDELAVPLAALMTASLAAARWPRPDAVVAVPTTFFRRFRRGYDQAELLARAVARESSIREVRALRRRAARRQTGRSRRERLALPASAFVARRAVPARILLVDDVLTTGATAAACARALRRAGAAEVHVLTLARTPRPGRIP